MSVFFDDLANTAAWLATAIVLMGAGFVMVDVLTPGNLRKQVSDSLNAGLLVGGKMIAVGIIVFVAIWTAPDSGIDGETATLLDGLIEAVLYSALGLIISAVMFLLVDLVLPADLRRLVEQREFDPAVCVAVGAEVGLALVIAAAIS